MSPYIRCRYSSRPMQLEFRSSVQTRRARGHVVVTSDDSLSAIEWDDGVRQGGCSSRYLTTPKTVRQDSRPFQIRGGCGPKVYGSGEIEKPRAGFRGGYESPSDSNKFCYLSGRTGQRDKERKRLAEIPDRGTRDLHRSSSGALGVRGNAGEQSLSKKRRSAAGVGIEDADEQRSVATIKHVFRRIDHKLMTLF